MKNNIINKNTFDNYKKYISFYYKYNWRMSSKKI